MTRTVRPVLKVAISRYSSWEAVNRTDLPHPGYELKGLKCMAVFFVSLATIFTTAVFFLAVLVSVSKAIKELRAEAGIYRSELQRHSLSQLTQAEQALLETERAELNRQISELYDGGGW